MRKIKILSLIPVITFAMRSEVEKYLSEYNIDLNREEYKCIVCGERVTKDNIGLLANNNEKTIVVCKKCMNKVNPFTLGENFLSH